ncbi:hypothetical protein N431DRAFT_463057 [Stipitochalara longipes BDJ]|nr:hypothetical protein N431DRAFT_463057 [Stipitochalara longipes BDJ]
MSSPTRKKAPAQSTFRPRNSKRLDDGNTLAPKRSFQNLRQLFKLPARVLTPFSNTKKHDEQRGRASMVNQTEPKTHRLLGEISPTRARALPSNSNTAPNLRKLASRNASATVASSPLRNISEPLPLPRFPQPDYSSRYTPSSMRSLYPKKQGSPPPDISRYSVFTEMGFEVRIRSPVRHALTDTTRHINNPLQYPRLSLGHRNASTSLNTVPYASRPTTSTSQQTSPPRPVFTNGRRPSRRAERSLSVLNQENRRNTYSSARPRPITTRDSLATTHEFRKSVSSLIQASAATTAPTEPASPPKALFTTNPRCIYTTQPDAFWAGRFSVLHDQFHNQMLASAINGPKIRQQFQRPDSKLQKKEKESTKSSTRDLEHDSPTGDDEEAIRHDEVRRCKRVFYTLQSLCVTDEAKHSLWGFQLRFARLRKMEACLPDGGTMEPVKGSPWTRLTHRKKSHHDDGGLGETF